MIKTSLSGHMTTSWSWSCLMSQMHSTIFYLYGLNSYGFLENFIIEAQPNVLRLKLIFNLDIQFLLFEVFLKYHPIKAQYHWLMIWYDITGITVSLPYEQFDYFLLIILHHILVSNWTKLLTSVPLCCILFKFLIFTDFTQLLIAKNNLGSDW